MKSRAAAKKTSKAPISAKSSVVKSTGARTRRNLAKPAKAKADKSEAASDAAMSAAVSGVAEELRAIREEPTPMPWIAPVASVAIEPAQQASAPSPVTAPQPRPWSASMPLYIMGFASLATLWMTSIVYRTVSRPTFSASAASVPINGPRPYVQVAATTMDNFVPGLRPSVTFRIKNTGQTPMFITEREVGMTNGAWNSIVLHSPATNPGLMDVGIGESADISGLFNQVLTKPMLEQIIAGKMPLRAYMRVEYQDSAGIKHHAVFCREYDAAKSRAMRSPVFMFPAGSSLMSGD